MKWYIKDGVLSRRGSKGAAVLEVEDNATAVVIPEGVTEIGEDAFYQCETITSVEIPGGVKRIKGSEEKGAFGGCVNLERVIFHEGTEEIGMSAFYDCSKLGEVMLASTVMHIGAYAFGNTLWQHAKGDIAIANNILLRWYREESKAIIPDGVKVIGAGAFEQNEALEEVVIPDSVTRIDRWAFYGCKNLQSVKLPKYLSGVGESAFEYTPWIDACKPIEIHIPDGAFTIAEKAFIGLSFQERKEFIKWENVYRMMGKDIPVRTEKDVKGPQIKRVVFASSVKSVGCAAFKGCQIAKLQLNEGLESIAEFAFAGCNILKDVVLPESVMELGESAFEHCDQDIMIRSGEKVFSTLIREVREATILKWLQGKINCAPYQEKPMKKYVNRTRSTWVEKVTGDNPDMLIKILRCGKTKLKQIDAYVEKFNDGKHPMMMAALLDYKQKSFSQEQMTLAADQKMVLPSGRLKIGKSYVV